MDIEVGTIEAGVWKSVHFCNTEVDPRHQHLIDSVFAHIQSETKLFVDRVSTVLQTCQVTAYSPPVECGRIWLHVRTSWV